MGMWNPFSVRVYSVRSPLRWTVGLGLCAWTSIHSVPSTFAQDPLAPPAPPKAEVATPEPPPSLSASSNTRLNDTATLERLGTVIGQGLQDAQELKRLGQLAKEAGDLRLAVRLLEQSLNSAQKEGVSPAEQARVMTALGDVLAQGGHAARGTPLLEAAGMMAHASGDPVARREALYALGREQWLAGTPQKAEKTLELALSLTEPPPPLVAKGLKSARPSRSLMGEEERTARLQLAEVYLESGQQLQALKQYRRIAEALATSDLQRLRAHVSEQVGWLESSQGNLTAAREAWGDALTQYRLLKDVSGEAQALDALAKVAFRQQNQPDAVDIGRKAAQAWASVPLPRQAMLSLAQVAWSHERLEQWPLALEQLEKALALARAGQFTEDEAALLARLGLVHQRMDNLDGAMTAFQQALELREKRQKPAGLGASADWVAPLALARLSSQLGKANTDQYFELALSRIDASNAGVGLNPIDLPWLDARLKAYDEVILRAMALGNVARAFDTTERARVRRYHDLSQAREGSPYLAAYQSASSGESGAAHALSAHRADVSPEVADRADEVLRGQSPRERARVNGYETPPMPVWNTKRALQFAHTHQTTLVSFFAIQEQLIAWVLTPDGRVEGMVLPMECSKVEEWVEWLQQRFSSPVPPVKGSKKLHTPSTPVSPLETFRSLDRDTYTLLRDLHRALIEPLLPWLPTSQDSALAVVSGGALLALPFGMLLDAEGSPLIQRHPVIQSPVTALLEPLYVRRNLVWVGKNELYLIGEGRGAGLPASAERMSTLDERLRKGAFRSSLDVYTVLTDLNATDEAAVNALARPTAVQLVAPAFYQDSHPWLSGLVFARGGEVADVDGVLTLAELPAGQLQARVAILPAGGAAGGPPVALLEPWALGWLGTGVQAVLQVQGNAGFPAPLADRFYQSLLLNRSPMNALRDMQLEALTQGVPFSQVGGLLMIGAL